MFVVDPSHSCIYLCIPTGGMGMHCSWMACYYRMMGGVGRVERRYSLCYFIPEGSSCVAEAVDTAP